MNLVRVSCETAVMMIAIGVAPVHVQHCRFGIEAEERQAKKDRDRPHRDKST